MATPTYELLESVTLATAASSVTFSSIDGGYGDLVLVVDKPSGGRRVSLGFNGDTGSNYANVSMNGNGSATNSYSATQAYVWANLYSSGGDNASLVTFQIMDYSATDKHKSVLVRAGGAGFLVGAQAARWANTAAITSLEVTGSTNSYPVGSTFNLYGVAK